MRFLPAVVCVATLAGLVARSAAAEDEFANTTVVFARGGALIKSDGKGRNETELVTLPDKATVRALRTDANGTILLADIAGTWSWMKLDGSAKTLTALPCDAGPAQLSQDGRYVLCRAKAGGASLVVNLVTGKLTPLNVPTLGARLIGSSGNERKLIWADKGAVWAAMAPRLVGAAKVAKQAPLRGFLPSPDGTNAVGIYEGEVFESPKVKKTSEILTVFALDGEGARRKAIQNGVPVDWSHDSKWILVQDGSSACVMLVAGGQYKCWRGYTAQSISPDGSYALLLGNRSSDKDKKSDKKKKKKGKKDRDRDRDTDDDDEAGDGGELESDQHGDEPIPTDDVPVPPPGGPVSLYRAALTGAYTKSPALIARVVDGAAVWVPTR
jgi:hypothetical protein